MSDLTKDEILELTDRINNRLAEFGPNVFDLTSPGVVRLAYTVIVEWQGRDKTTEREAMVRQDEAAKIHDTAYTEGWQAGRESIRREQAVMAEMSPVREEAEDKRLGIAEPTYTPLAIDPETTAEYDQAWLATHNNGHAVEVSGDGKPLSIEATATLGPEHTTVTPLVPRRPRTLAEVDVDLTDLKLGSEERAAMLREIIGELQFMSQKEEMPTMAAWDAGKPTHLPKATALCFRYQIGWERLAEYARLKFERKNKAKA